jgi:hypothetical protein
MRPSRRRRSRARPRPATRATTSWAFRWEAERDEQNEQLALVLEPGVPIVGTRRRPRKDVKVGRP